LQLKQETELHLKQSTPNLLEHFSQEPCHSYWPSGQIKADEAEESDDETVFELIDNDEISAGPELDDDE